MITRTHAGGRALAAALLLAAGCASTGLGRLDRPTGETAMGLTFGASREDVAAVLRDAEIPFTEAPGDPDALLASRCPAGPSSSGCRLLFGPRGLFAAQVEAPSDQAGRLVAAAERGLGPPSRRGDDDARPEGGLPALIAAWDAGGWTVGVSREVEGGGAVLRVERDAVAPPVVIGVPLGRHRTTVEHMLELQGAVVVQRDDEATTYLGCPHGDGAALTCVVTFLDGHAASVTEVHPTPADDDEAVAAWRALAERYRAELGAEPVTSACPAHGPERATGDCTATWGSERLVVVVGAHRNAGGDHRGVISVYTSWAYPPLAGGGGD